MEGVRVYCANSLGRNSPRLPGVEKGSGPRKVKALQQKWLAFRLYLVRISINLAISSLPLVIANFLHELSVIIFSYPEASRFASGVVHAFGRVGAVAAMSMFTTFSVRDIWLIRHRERDETSESVRDLLLLRMLALVRVMFYLVLPGALLDAVFQEVRDTVLGTAFNLTMFTGASLVSFWTVERQFRRHFGSQSTSHLSSEEAPEARIKMRGTPRVFIGHGHNSAWRELKDFLEDRLGLLTEEFNRVSVAGIPTAVRLAEMLAASSMAFLIFTAEDDHVDGRIHARLNVVHEAGLFQGRHGFNRAIVLLEEGCGTFSNLDGLTYIGFPKDRISAAFEEIRRVVEREGLIPDAKTTA